MQIPILMGVEGEAKEIIEKYGAGLCFEPENEKDFKEKLLKILTPSIYKECQKGCQILAKDFDREKLAKNMLDIINTIK